MSKVGQRAHLRLRFFCCSGTLVVPFSNVSKIPKISKVSKIPKVLLFFHAAKNEKTVSRCSDGTTASPCRGEKMRKPCPVVPMGQRHYPVGTRKMRKPCPVVPMGQRHHPVGTRKMRKSCPVVPMGQRHYSVGCYELLLSAKLKVRMIDFSFTPSWKYFSSNSAQA